MAGLDASRQDGPTVYAEDVSGRHVGLEVGVVPLRMLGPPCALAMDGPSLLGAIARESPARQAAQTGVADEASRALTRGPCYGASTS